MIEAQIDIDSNSRITHYRTVSAEDREALELKLEEIIESVVNNGYLDDLKDDEWEYIPPHAIRRINIKFIDVEEDDGT